MPWPSHGGLKDPKLISRIQTWLQGPQFIQFITYQRSIQYWGIGGGLLERYENHEKNLTRCSALEEPCKALCNVPTMPPPPLGSKGGGAFKHMIPVFFFRSSNIKRPWRTGNNASRHHGGSQSRRLASLLGLPRLNQRMTVRTSKMQKT